MFKRWTSKSKRSVDLSFLNQEEVNAVLEVLERDKEVRRMNSERLKEVKKTNPNKLWLKGVTGEWFEDLKKSKFNNQTDLSKLLKVSRTWQSGKHNQPASTDSKLTRSQNCPQVKNVSSDMKSSGNSKGHESGDPVSKPVAAASESDRQKAELLLEKDRCSNYKSLQLESPAMLQQIDVHLKVATVPRVKRKVYMYRDICKHVFNNEQPKVLGQDPETKTSNVAVDEHGKIMSMENVSTSELQKNTRDEDGIKNLAEDVQARLCRNDNKMNAGKLSGSTEETSLIIGCNTKNVRHTSQARDVLADEQQGNVCTRVELDHYKADNGLSSDPQTSLSSSIIHPQNELQDHPITNGHDLPTRSNSDCHSLKSKCAMERTLLDLLVESQILPDIFNSPKNYSSNNICEPSQRNESDSTCSSETVPFSSMTGQRGHNTGNMHVLQQNWSDNLLDTSQKTDSALLIQGSKSEAIHLASSAVPVCIPNPLLSTCTNCRSNVNALNHNNVSFKSGIVGDSLQISQLKPGISLSLRNQHCQARATSCITINNRKRQQYLRTDDTNIVTPVKRNNDSLQHHGHKQERTDLFSNPKAEARSVIMLALSKTRMETAKTKNADAPLSDDKKQTCKVEGRSNSLLSIQVIGSQLPTCDRDIDVAPVHASNNIGAALQRADNDYLQNAKPDIGHKLSADPKNAPQHLSSIVLSSYNNAIQGNPLKSDDVSVESANNILQNESGTSNVIEMSVTQSPKHEKQVFCNQRSSSNNSNLTLGVNSMENDKPLSIITSSKVLRIKYQMVDLSVRRDSLTAARLRYKSEANHVLSLPDATKAPLLDIKNDMKNTLQNMPPHKIRSILTDIPDVDNMQNYQTVKASTPPSDAMTQCQSPGYIHTNEVTLSKRYPTGGISNVAQQNSCESLPETVKDQQSPVTKVQLRQDAIRDGGKEILPKDRSETSSKLISENSVFDQCILAESMDSNQMKSQANVQLGDNFTTCPKSAVNYPPENNLFLSQDTLTGQQSPTNSHNLLFHSPVESCTNEILEDCLSENYAVVHNQSETTCVSSFLDQMNSQPPLVNTTDGNGCESLNPSLDNCIHFVNTGLNKHLESCSSDPPSDSLNDPASTVQHSADRSMSVNSDLPLGRLVVQESLAAATYIKKNTLPHYSHEEPCDQNKSENLAESYTAITSPNNYPSKHSVYLSRNNHNIHVEEGVNEYLQNNSEHQGKSLPSEVLTDVKATATDIEMITDTLQHNTSNKTLHDEKSYDRFVSKKLHEMNSSLSSTLGTSKRYITVENNNKDDSQLHFPLGGDNTVDGRCKEYLEKGNCKLSTSDSLIDLQPLNFMENITKTPTSSLSINNGSVGPDKEKTVKHCQSEYHSVSSLNACTAAYFTEGATNTVQNMCPDNNVLTFCGRTHDNNAQDKSKPQDLLTGDQFSTNTNTIPKFSMIPNNKDTTDHELLNSPGVSTTSEDRGNAILQISKRPTHAKNGINSFTNIPQKEMLLTQFPLNYNTTPAAESIKTVENYQSDNRCTGLSQDGVTEQQSVTNLDNDRDKPWDHLLDISEIEINKNFQKGKPEINNVISPAIRHHSAVSVTGITKNTLQRGTSKVTDIYHHERPSTRFKLNFLQRAKSVPSLPEMTGQWQTDNTSFFSNQEKLKTPPPIRHNSNLLLRDENVEKYQAISSIDEENEQCTLTNTAHDGKDTSQKCPTNIDGITVNRRFSNDCDPSDGCEIKCTPVGDVLNNGAVGAEIAVNKCVLNDTAESNKITVDSLTDLQTIPTITVLNTNIGQNHLAKDFDIGPEFPLNYNISLAAECIKTTEGHHSEERCLLLSQDGVTEQQSVTNLDNYRDKPLEHLLDNRKMEINENFQKDKPEINNAISPTIRHHSAASVTGITKNTLQRGTSKVTDIYHHERPSTRFKLNFLQRAKSVPSLPEMTGQWQTDNTSFFSNQEKLKTPPPIRHNSNLLLRDENVEKYQAISSIDEENEQCTLTNTAHDGKDTSQKCPTNIDGITVNRRFSNDCDPSDGCEIKCTPVGDVLNNGAVGAEIAVNKCVLNDTAESNKITVDSLTDLQTIPTINAINRKLEQDYLANDFDIGPEFPLSYNISLAAECIKTTEGHRSEEICLVLSQNGVSEHQSVTNLDTPLEHLLNNTEMEINENFQKDEPKINNVVSPVMLHHSAASVTDITKNTSLQGNTKVTDIYHRRRPSNKFKLDFLQGAKSIPSLSELTEQSQSDNILFFSNQEKLKTPPPLRHNINLLPSDENVEKCQAVSSPDEVNEQCTLTNTAHDSMDTSQKCPTNIDGITVNRRFSDDCDPPDGCEIKCTPSPLNPDSVQLMHVDTSLNNECSPTGHILNYVDDAADSKSADIHENKRADLSGSLQISPISTSHGNKNKPWNRSSIIVDNVLSKGIDELNATHILPILDPVVSQQPSNSLFSYVDDVLNNGVVGAEIAVNPYVQNDTAENDKIPTVDSLSDLKTVLTITVLNTNIGQNHLAKDFEICHKFPLNYNTPPAAESIKTTEGHHSEERCLLLSQDGVTEQQSVTNLDNYRDKPLEHLMDNRKMEINENFQKDKPEINNAISPTIRHHSAASVTGITKNTLQRGTSKVTDIYHHERPSTRFKLNFLQRAKSVPSLPEMTGQWQTDNTSFFSNQEKLKTPPPIRHNSNLLLRDENVEKYQAISSIDEENEQCTLTNTAHDGKDTSQKCPTNIDGITVNRRFSNDCDPSDGCEIKCTPVGDVLNNGAVGAEIAVNKCVLNDTAESNKITVDSLTDLQTIPTITVLNTNIGQNHLAKDFDIGPEFPLNYNISLAAECIKTTEGHHSEERCLLLSQDGVTEQQFVTNLDNYRDKPLEHLLDNRKMEINENFQKDKPEINNAISPTIRHHSAASVTGITKNTLQRGTSKVTDIYHHERPSTRFKLNFLQRAKSVPSLPEMTGQWQTDNTSFFSNQEKLKTPPPIRHNSNLLLRDENVEKYQAISSIDEENEQCTLTNTAHDGKDTSQKCPTNIDGITVNRRFSNDCDPSDGCEIKCIPVGDVLNNGAVGAEIAVNKCVLNDIAESNKITVDSLTDLQTIPTITVLNTNIGQNHLAKDFDIGPEFPLNYNISLAAECIKTTEGHHSEERCLLLSQDGVTEQQSVTNLDNYRDKPLEHLLDNRKMEINENFQKDKPEINNAISPTIRHHSAASVTGITKNTLQCGTSKVTDIYHHERPSTRFKLNFLQRAKSVPSLPEMTGQWQTDNTSFFSNQEKLKTPPPIRHNSNLLLRDENVEKYQAISSIDEENEQCTLTNTAHDGKDTSQKCPTNIDGITVNRRFSNDCDPSDGCEIKCTPVGDVLNNGAVGAEIAVNKCVLNDTAESNKITVDSLTDIQTIPTINAINRKLEQDYLANDFDISPEFPLSYNISLAAECIKTTEGHRSEEICLVLSQNGVTEHQSVTNLDTPLEHLLNSTEMEINENFQKDEPKINNVVSPVMLHHSAASVTDITKNTSLQGNTKVTDIYHRRRPSNKFKLDFLQGAKSIPSLSELTEQWQSDNILFFSNQEKLKTPPPLRHNINLLPSDENVAKCQAVSSTDEVNEQCTLTNTAHDSMDTSQKCPTNIDGITVKRKFSDDCDPQEGCGIKCTRSPLNPDSGQLLHVDPSFNNEHKPTSQVLNYADSKHSKRLDNHKNKRVDLSGTLQISPISTAHSNKNKSLNQSSTVLSKGIDEFNATHILPMLGPVISQQPSNSSFKMLSDLLNNGAVGAEIETDKISPIDSLTGFQTVQTITDIHENLGQDYLTRDFDIFHDELTNEKSNINRLHKTNDAPPSLKVDVQYITTNIISKNQDKRARHSARRADIVMGRTNKPNAKDHFLLPSSQQAPSSIIKNKQSLIHSPLRSDFEMNVADVKSVAHGQLQNNRDASLPSPIGLKSSSDTSCGNNIQFQNSSPKKNMCSRKTIGIKSANDTNLAKPDHLTEQESPDDLTYNKNNKYLNEPMKDRDVTFDRRWKDIRVKTEKYSNSSGSTPPDSPPGRSPQNEYIRKNYSTNSCDISPQDIDIAKENRKVFRYRRKSFPGRMLENGRSGTCTTNKPTFNSLQHCYPEKQIDSEFREINDLHNRLNTNSDFSQHRVNSFSTDKDDNSSVNNNYQTGATRFSKKYSRFKSSRISESHNVQNRYGHLFRTKCLKDIHSHCNLSSQHDQENVFSTNIRLEPKLTIQERQAKPFPSFLSYKKRSRLYGYYPDLPFSNRNEFDYNIWSSYNDRQDDDELINRNEDESNISKKEAVKKDTYQENKKHGRQCKPEFDKKAASRSIEDVFDPLPSEVTQDLGMDDETVKNNEYFPVDIKMFWPKENPTDIIRLLSSTSTGSKLSEESLSPQSHRVPAEILRPNLSCYSGTDSDTTTDDEYFLDSNETAKESAL